MRLHLTVAKAILRDARGGPTASEDAEVIHAGMSALDGCCVAVAVGLLGACAMYAEHRFQLNGDIVFEGSTIVGTHPTHVALKRALVSLASMLVGGGNA